MVRIILEGLGAVLIFVYVLVDIIIPAFSKWKFFWFAKSFFKDKSKEDFETKVENARKAYQQALKDYVQLDRATKEEVQRIEEKLAKAKEVYAQVSKQKEDLKTKQTNK